MAEYATVKGLPFLGALNPLRRDAMGFSCTHYVSALTGCTYVRWSTIEALLGLTSILSQFRLIPATGALPTMKPWITLRPQERIRVRLVKEAIICSEMAQEIKGNTDPSFDSLSHNPIQVRMPKYIGKRVWLKRGFSNRKFVATAPPKYPVNRMAPRTEVRGIT